jgi:hypothetical protein
MMALNVGNKGDSDRWDSGEILGFFVVILVPVFSYYNGTSVALSSSS